MRSFIKIIPSLFFAILLSWGLCSCSSDDEVRQPSDILGVWSPSDNLYLEFCDQNIIHKLDIEYQNNESIGEWTKDVYYYEPGYNLVIYLTGEPYANVYEIVELNEKKMTWCKVDEVMVENSENIAHIIGEIINKAQEGYRLNPELYQSFRYIPQDQFFDILENLDIYYPWTY